MQEQDKKKQDKKNKIKKQDKKHSLDTYSWHPLCNFRSAVSIVLPPLKNNNQLFLGVAKD